MSDTDKREPSVPIAIVGMACIFPQAENLTQYWDNIIHEVDCITDVPASRWHVDDYFDPDPLTPDKTYCKRGGFLPEVAFDPIEFGLPPNILESTDASQLLSLVVAKEALADAGYGAGVEFNRDRTGVILGVGGGQKLLMPLCSRLQQPVWKRALTNSGLSDADAQNIVEKMETAYIPWTEDTFPGVLGNVVAGRIASRFNLGGTNCVVDAACAASLSAATMAIDDLVAGRSDMMITGGVDTDNSIFMYMCFSKTPALTPNSHARPFDADSDGILIGEGIGMLVLKRLADAERDGNRIYAVIKGIGSSSDGRSKSIYAPREDGQIKALTRAYEAAGVDPETVSLIESHGTGTKAGDVCEVAALKQVFDAGEGPRVALGSVKSQIGHTKAAAGAAGLIKAALALHQQVLPPTLHIKTPNPKLGLDESAFYLNSKARPWLQNTKNAPRRAGVSAFGFGGTNFHFVLEEYKKSDKARFSQIQPVPRTVLLHAESVAGLITKCKNTWADLKENERVFESLTDQNMDIPHGSPRLGFVAKSRAEASDLLTAAIAQLEKRSESEWTHQGIFYRNESLPKGTKVVALFPGQGSQYVNMGRGLALHFDDMRTVWQRVDETIGDVVFPKPAFDRETRKEQLEKLRQTQYAQPAIGALCAGMYKLLQNLGFEPDMFAGHSFGELTALWASGALEEDDFFALAQARGQAMASLVGEDAGAMLAVMGDTADVESLVANMPRVRIANYNSPQQVVIAGPKGEIERAHKVLKENGLRCVVLPVSAAFHTLLVGHAKAPFADALKKVTFHTPERPVYSNTTSERYLDRTDAIQKTLKDQILESVLFQQMIENIYAEGGTCFVEIGPRDVLTHLVRDILKDRPHWAVAMNANPELDSDLQFRQAVVQLRVGGISLQAWRVSPAPAGKADRKRKMTVRLSAANYVSSKTREKYEKTLKDSHVIQQTQNVNLNDSMQTTGGAMSTNQHAEEHRRQMIEQLNYCLSQFAALETETLRVHEQYMQSHKEYAQTFAELLKQQYALLGVDHNHQAPAPPPQPQPVSAPMHQPPMPYPSNVNLNGQQMPVVPPAPHAPYYAPQHSAPQHSAPQHSAPQPTYTPPPAYSQQDPVSNGHYVAPQPVPPPSANPQVQRQPQPVMPPAPMPPVQSTQRVPSAPTSPPVPASAGVGSLDVETLKQSLIKITSETTGYPADVIEMDMDLEADLGIDSIKRVEILGAMQEAHPNLPQINPEDLAELQTFSQIVDYLTPALSA